MRGAREANAMRSSWSTAALVSQATVGMCDDGGGAGSLTVT